MKIKKAVFIFNDWKFIFTPKDKIISHGRNYKIFSVKIHHKKEVHLWNVTCFVPSACICRRLKKRILKSDL